MCDKDTHEETPEFLELAAMNRRQFTKLSAAFGFSTAVGMMLPSVANAQSVTEQDVTVTTPDGEADCYFVHPSAGSHAAVIVWPDILGLRPAFRAMGKRLAESGYSVLVVNPYYRSQKAPVVEEGASFGNPETRNIVLPLARTLNATTHMSDARAFVSYLDAQPSVDTSRKIGTTGYCMGGPIVMRTAAAIPERIGAGASFHGGGLATDRDDSPHLLIPQMKASFLIAVAANDDENEPEVKNILRDSFAAADLSAEIEVYEGAMHGWCPPDSAVYNEAQAERAWTRLLALFNTALA